DASGTHYLFARFEQTTLSLQNRLNVTLTPALSIEWYTEPFVSGGTFSDVRELAVPSARRNTARYAPFAVASPGGVRFTRLRSNAVLRWEYRPGSVLYVVANQGRDYSDENAADFSVRDGSQLLFAQRPANTVLVK